MNGESIYLVTDQGPATGIGVYAGALARLLGGNLPNLKLLSLCYLPGQEQPGWMRLRRFALARSLYDIPLVMRRNYRHLREEVPAETPIHFCGVSFSSVVSYPRSVVTVHDYYPRSPALTNLGRPRVILRDLASLRQYIELPNQVRTARVRVVPTHDVENCLFNRCSLTSTVIHHWVDRARFRPREKPRARELLGLPDEGKLVLTVSTGSSNKNYDLIARVSSSLRGEYQLVLGGGREAPRAVQGIRLPRLSEDAYPQVFNACDVYFHASTQEGFGWPLIEAMASGLPIVALRTRVAEEVLGDAAVFVQPSDPIHRVIETIERATNEPLRSELAARGEGRCSLFSENIAREAYLRIYRAAFGL